MEDIESYDSSTRVCPSCHGSKRQNSQLVMTDWESDSFQYGLFGCFSDPTTCLQGFHCPCVKFGINYSTWHGDGSLLCGCQYAWLTCCPCFAHGSFQMKVRHRFNISPTSDINWDDVIATTFCSCCALVQESRELEWREQEARRRGIRFEEKIYFA